MGVLVGVSMGVLVGVLVGTLVGLLWNPSREFPEIILGRALYGPMPENFERHWSILISGEIPMDQSFRGNQSIYLHRGGPLLENGLDRPKNRYGRYGFPSFLQHFHIYRRGGWSQSLPLNIFFFCSLDGSGTLFFFSLLFWKTARKTTKKARIFSLLRTPKILGKEGKNAQKSKELLGMEKSKGIQKSKERKIRVDISQFPVIGPDLFLTKSVWTNGPESSSRDSPYTLALVHGCLFPVICQYWCGVWVTSLIFFSLLFWIFGGSDKGWFPKGWFRRMFPCTDILFF